MVEPSASKRATFAASSFANLRAAMGEGTGEPLRVALADIDEDPDQPRRAFDTTELESLASTIRERGVLQPIGVLPPVDGRYKLVFGARRLRASRLAGVSDIPAVIVSAGQRDLTTQVIENQHRAGLSNAEMAAAIDRLHAAGKRGGDIAAICNLKDYQVTAFRAVGKLPAFLRACLDASDIRAIYDLYRAWQKHPDVVQASVIERGPAISVTDARRLIESVTGRATGSLVLDRDRGIPTEVAAITPLLSTHPLVSSIDMTQHPTVGRTETTDGEESLRPGRAGHQAAIERLADPPQAEQGRPPQTSPAASPQQTVEIDARHPAGTPIFLMAWNGQQGRLVTGILPAELGCVFLDIGGDRLTARFNELRPVDAR